jgi:hypothetical protein
MSRQTKIVHIKSDPFLAKKQALKSLEIATKNPAEIEIRLVQEAKPIVLAPEPAADPAEQHLLAEAKIALKMLLNPPVIAAGLAPLPPALAQVHLLAEQILAHVAAGDPGRLECQPGPAVHPAGGECSKA